MSSASPRCRCLGCWPESCATCEPISGTRSPERASPALRLAVMPASQTPIRVAINDDYDLVVSGVAAILAPYADRIDIVELDSNVPSASDVDIVLYDTFGQD